ncbi:MAG: pyridoxamine 5'-phosphate oxidase family protein [Pirellulales bacterium]|nr:pyridoxamine 5'-phosphate oxidase family protein [Pirellulales bacterium]
MTLREYFANARGVGVLATADAKGTVNVAVYSRPHFPGDDDNELAFIMKERLSYENVQSNPRAAYLFVERGDDYVGRRLFLTKIREESDQEKIRDMRRRGLPMECDEDASPAHLVYFRVDGTRPLVGG